jgi:chromosomal replication initiator protein
MRVSKEDILETVSEFYDVSKEKIINGGRKREYVKPRQIVMFLLRKELKESYPYIGKKLGGKDHTTVIHAVEKIEGEKEEDESLNSEISLIKEQLYNK